MKLSDKKNYKIKGKNNSRKKHNLRQKSTKHQKSKRRHPKKLDLKRKTMKIYVGGHNISGLSETFSTMTYKEQLAEANMYFVVWGQTDLIDTRLIILANTMLRFLLVC